MLHSYNRFAPFYRALITSSGHLANEQSVLDQVLMRFKVKHNDLLLDAACGTGDALNYLHKNKYAFIEGMDGSAGMLMEAATILPNIPLYNIAWEDIDQNINWLKKEYKLIFLLSVSFLHADIDFIPNVLASFYRLLGDGGILVFDNRRWIPDLDSLLELNRITDKCIELQTIEVDHKKYNVLEQCYYKGDRQYVKYFFHPLINDDESIEIEVSYAKISTMKFVSLLKKAGFIDVGFLNYPEWPYEIIYAKK